MLESKLADLEERLRRTPRNSSMPPSAEGFSKPPSPSRAERRAAGRKQGKQPRAPGCLPCLRPAARRSARDGEGGFENPSADGGIEELRGVRRRRSSKSASFDSSIDTCARSNVFSDAICS